MATITAAAVGFTPTAEEVLKSLVRLSREIGEIEEVVAIFLCNKDFLLRDLASQAPMTRSLKDRVSSVQYEKMRVELAGDHLQAAQRTTFALQITNVDRHVEHLKESMLLLDKSIAPYVPSSEAPDPGDETLFKEPLYDDSNWLTESYYLLGRAVGCRDFYLRDFVMLRQALAEGNRSLDSFCELTKTLADEALKRMEPAADTTEVRSLEHLQIGAFKAELEAFEKGIFQVEAKKHSSRLIDVVLEQIQERVKLFDERELKKKRGATTEEMAECNTRIIHQYEVMQQAFAEFELMRDYKTLSDSEFEAFYHTLIKLRDWAGRIPALLLHRDEESS